MSTQLSVLEVKSVLFLLYSKQAIVEASHSRGLTNLCSQGLTEQFNMLCQSPALLKCHGLACATGLYEFLIQPPTCVCRRSLTQTDILPGFLANLHHASAAVGAPACPTACQQVGSPNGWERSRSLGTREKAGCDQSQVCKCCSNGARKPPTPWPQHIASHSFQPWFWQRRLLCLFVVVMGWVIHRWSSAFQSP